MAKQQSNPDNGPRIEQEVPGSNGLIETTTLVERSKDHPAGPGVTVVKSWGRKA